MNGLEQHGDRYDRHGILRAEWIYGSGYNSPGGEDSVRLLAPRLGLEPGHRVLDIGCGAGAAAIYISNSYGVDVVGLDILPAMLELCEERYSGLGSVRVRFVLGDVLTSGFEPGSFDRVWSRDTLLHIANKPAVLERVSRWLKPGGVFLLTDFCRSNGPITEAFRTRVEEDWKIYLWSLEDYRKGFLSPGFSRVETEDLSELFERYLRAELARLEAAHPEFLRTFTPRDAAYLEERWQQKLEACVAGQLRWGFVMAWR